MPTPTSIIDPQWMVYPATVKGLLQAAAGLGADHQALLTAAAIDPNWLTETDQCVPVSAFFRLYERAEEACATADIGLYCGRIAYVSGLNLQLYMTTICKTFRDYLNMIPSLLKMQGDIGEIRVRSQGPLIGLEWHALWAPSDQRRYLSDAALAMSALIVDSLCLQPIRPVQACFSYPQPADTRLLEQLFACDLAFGQARSCLYFERTVLHYPITQLDDLPDESLSITVQRLFADDDQDPFLTRTRDCIQRLLPTGAMTMDRVAAELTVSRRTLQRRLTERDTQFLQVLQHVRDELARRYLHDKRLSITEIAFLLGYGDAGSFSNAFKSWHGLSPSDYRQHR